MPDKLHLVYVLVSSEKDSYLEQAYVSMFSAKYYMPDVSITLVVDKPTNESFFGTRKEEVKYADNILVVDMPEDTDAKKRSRLIKTSLRERIKGDYLFVDTDTIVVKPLYDILKTDADIAACYDLHATFLKDRPNAGMIVTRCSILDFDVSQEKHYFNSGVMWARDTELAHKFYKMWNDTLKEYWEKGSTFDQPALAKTDSTLGHVIKPLAPMWNCQLEHGVKYLKDAKVVHYFATSRGDRSQLFVMFDKKTLTKIKDTGHIPNDVVETVKDPFHGLADTTLLIAGDSVHFAETETYWFAMRKYGTRKFTKLNNAIILYDAVASKLRRIIRRIF